MLDKRLKELLYALASEGYLFIYEPNFGDYRYQVTDDPNFAEVQGRFDALRATVTSETSQDDSTVPE
jgi:hypothetical protein